MRKGNSASNLESLFGARRGESLGSSLRLVERTSILPDPQRPQPRTQFDQGALDELANSMKTLRAHGAGVGATGILQPLLVRLATPAERVSSREDTSPENSAEIAYVLLAGERRWRAARQAEIERVPVVLSETGDEASSDATLLLQIIENLQRENLAPLDEANAFARLKEEQNLSIRELALVLGKTRGYLTNRLDLLKMDEALQAMVSSREDTLKHAALIAGVEDGARRAQLIEMVLTQGASVLQIRQSIEGKLPLLADQQAPFFSEERTRKNEPTSSQSAPSVATSSETSDADSAVIAVSALLRDHLAPASKMLDRFHRQLQETPTLASDEKARLQKQLATLQKRARNLEKHLADGH